MDASTGEVLLKKMLQHPYPVASMSKLMTEYIVLDLIESGSIHWNDKVVISETANKVGEGAVVYHRSSGDHLTLQDLFKCNGRLVRK